MIRWFEKNYILSWIITFLIAIAIFTISLITFPPSENPSTSNIRAILYHIFAFFFLAIFLQISLVRGKYKPLIIVSLFLAFLYGISDEIHQYFVPGRHSSILDIGLNSLGILFAAMIYLITIRFRELRKLNYSKNLQVPSLKRKVSGSGQLKHLFL